MRPVVKEEASAFGRYPSSSAAFSIFARVAGDTDAPSVKHRETADLDTPARAATSLSVTRTYVSPNLSESEVPLTITKVVLNHLSDFGLGAAWVAIMRFPRHIQVGFLRL